ncbi:MAG: glycosyl transferase [Micromonosporaceae bacterium]|nr:glycosyl transferase [Micromonosporaceae bacterium]
MAATRTADSRTAANPYGWADAAAREYVITRPDTPTPWLNYLGAGGYGGIISNTAGGFSFDRDPRNRRVSRYRYNAIPADQPGRYIYIRDCDDGSFWSATWQPVKAPVDGYECRHGPGYTRITTERSGIRAGCLYFVPPTTAGDPCPVEAWVLTLENTGDRPRTLRTFSYLEFAYPDAAVDQDNLDWAGHIVSSRFDEGTGAILVGTVFRPTTHFFAADRPALGYDTDRDAFVGAYRDLSNPAVVAAGTPTSTGSPRGNSIGSLCHELRLAPGQRARLVYLAGVTDEPSAIRAALASYREPGAVEAAFERLRADWDAYLSVFTVDTPDPLFDLMVNLFNPVQCRTTLYWSRFVSGYETGLGRGMGTRDSGQDTLATAPAAPEHARDMLTRIWRMQFGDGHTWHQFFPLTGEGGPGLAAEFPDWPQWFSDDHLWLVISVCAYLRETGDYGYLDQRVSYQDGSGGSIWAHLIRAVEFTAEHLGPHGLPRIGFADWDDTHNVDHGSGLAESVWTGMLYCRALLDLADLAVHTGRSAEGGRMRERHAAMAAAIDTHGWDGRWYARSFDDEGKPVGVASEPVHRINLIPQLWSAIGEVGPRDRAEQAMRSAHEQLNTEYGLMLLDPPYHGADPRVRGTSTYPPGAKENGGIFCHANTWAVVAAAMLGDGDRAYRYYRQLLPLARTDADTFRVEPYVFCQNICGPAHPQYGMGRNAWLTGTATWAYVAATQWILGIRPTHTGLRVAPCLPSQWPGYRATRLLRGTRYEITVRREGEGNPQLRVDGRPCPGDVVPFAPPEVSTVEVEVILPVTPA